MSGAVGLGTVRFGFGYERLGEVLDCYVWQCLVLFCTVLPLVRKGKECLYKIIPYSLRIRLRTYGITICH